MSINYKYIFIIKNVNSNVRLTVGMAVAILATTAALAPAFTPSVFV